MCPNGSNYITRKMIITMQGEPSASDVLGQNFCCIKVMGQSYAHAHKLSHMPHTSQCTYVTDHQLNYEVRDSPKQPFEPYVKSQSQGNFTEFLLRAIRNIIQQTISILTLRQIGFIKIPGSEFLTLKKIRSCVVIDISKKSAPPQCGPIFL